jgi:hypothetical protein
LTKARKMGRRMEMLAEVRKMPIRKSESQVLK